MRNSWVLNSGGRRVIHIDGAHASGGNSAIERDAAAVVRARVNRARRVDSCGAFGLAAHTELVIEGRPVPIRVDPAG